VPGDQLISHCLCRPNLLQERVETRLKNHREPHKLKCVSST
jgi:hypothetical protein